MQNLLFAMNEFRALHNVIREQSITATDMRGCACSSLDAYQAYFIIHLMFGYLI